jgi:hypothetical protein
MPVRGESVEFPCLADGFDKIQAKVETDSGIKINNDFGGGTCESFF